MHQTQSEYAARSALARVLSTVRENETKFEADQQLNPLSPVPLELREVLASDLVWQHGPYRVRLHFQPEQPGYSTDNLTGEVPRRGWADGDGVTRIPPYSADLVFIVEGPGGTEFYRALVQRIWPFAAYSATGPIMLMGGVEASGVVQSPANPSRVLGPVYTQWRSNEALGGARLEGYGTGVLTGPKELLANLEARVGYHPQSRPDHPLIIGSIVGLNPPPEPREVAELEESVFYYYGSEALPYRPGDREDSWTFSVPQQGILDGGNLLDGDLVIDYQGDPDLQPRVVEGSRHPNTFLGQVEQRPGLALDPLYYFRADHPERTVNLENQGFQDLPLPPSEAELERHFGPPPLDCLPYLEDAEPAHLLVETLKLSPEFNSTGGNHSSHYRFQGSLSNRRALYTEDAQGESRRLLVQENFAGLELQDVVFYVAGDLDLGSNSSTREIPIYGSGATLVVDGRLVLGNATLNSGDQGFVVFAREIVFKGGGDFRGLLISSGSVSILGSGPDPLKIEGGLLCGGYGGITLRGVELEHQPRYLKSINGGGDLRLYSWSRISGDS